MSDRSASPAAQALATWRKSVDAAIQTLQQRPVGSPNGLIVPGGGAGTFTAPAFAANWGSFAGRAPVAYALTADGFVHLRGHAQKSTAWGLPDTIFTLPAGYNPPVIETFAAFVTTSGGGNGSGGVQVDAAGNVQLLSSSVAWSAANYVSLSGIVFYVGAQ